MGRSWMLVALALLPSCGSSGAASGDAGRTEAGGPDATKGGTHPDGGLHAHPGDGGDASKVCKNPAECVCMGSDCGPAPKMDASRPETGPLGNGSACSSGAECKSGVCSSQPVLKDNLDSGAIDAAPPGEAGARDGGRSDAALADAPSGTLVCQPPTPHDGIQNDSETDVDCGGFFLASGAENPVTDDAPACADGKQCVIDSDCLSGFCSTLTNRCVAAQSCKGLVPPAVIQDITVEAATIPGGADAVGQPDMNGAGQHAGIDTCGGGEATDPASLQHHESCCVSLPVPGLAACSPAKPCPAGETCSSATLGVCQVRLDKYEVTTGRMRQFVESVKSLEGGYDVQAWAKAQFNGSDPITPAGDALKLMGMLDFLGFLPVGDTPTARATDDIVNQLGATTMDSRFPSGHQGCFVKEESDGASTYWWPSAELEESVSSPPRPFTQDFYDIKPQNCVPYWMAAAFCAWDGGFLPLQSEGKVVYGASDYPWGPHLYPNPYGSNTTVLTRANALDPAGVPIATFITGNPNDVSALPGYTVDWHNANLGGSTGLGNFYFYPSYPNSNPGYGPLASMEIIDTLSHGLNLSPYIAAPGRFLLDETSLRSASGDGWMDFGANVMEWYRSEGVPWPSGESAPVFEGASMPAVYWEGGSWEGHDMHAVGFLEPMETQYGKTGLRCARPIERVP